MKLHTKLSLPALASLFLLTFSTLVPQAQCQNSHLAEVKILEEKSRPVEALSSMDFHLKNKQLFVRIQFNGEKLEPPPEMIETVEPGGQYFLYLDGVVVKQAHFSGTTFNTQEKLPPQQLISGEHMLRLELQHPYGKQYTSEIRFIFDILPTISTSKIKVENGQIATDVSLDCFPTGRKAAGQLNILIDNNLIAAKPVMASDNGSTKTLTNWLGRSITIGELAQGNHVLSIQFQGANGGESIIHKPFTVDTIPELNIKATPNGDTITASFVSTETAINGFIDMFYNQQLILSQQVKDPSITVTRAEVVEALQNNNISVPEDGHIPLIIGLRSVSNVENWQQVVLK